MTETMAMSMDEHSPMMNGSAGAVNGGTGGSSANGTQVHTATRTPTSQTAAPFTCSGCGKHIVDKFLLKALDVYWHEDCLKCGCCDCRLGEVGSTLYTRANLILCKRDYLRLFGTSGSCAACCKVIPAFEMVMRAKNNVYHLECFACSCCQQRFCVGDRFYLMDNKILCEYDYEERLIFASMHTSAAAQIQRRVTDIQQPGNGAIGGGLVANRGFGQSLMEVPFGPSASLSLSSSRDGATALKSFLPHQQPPPQQRHFAFQPTAFKRPAPTKERHSPSDGSSSGYGSPDSGLLLMDDR